MSWVTDIISLGAWLFGVKPGPDVAPIGPPHEYPAALSQDEFSYGRYQCMNCTRHDLKRIRYTEPPCPRIHGPTRERPDFGEDDPLS